jgi:hypothetical protein
MRMKHLFFLFMVMMAMAINTPAQTTIAFTYDAGGNMIQRQVQVVPPSPNARFNGVKLDSTEIMPPLDFKVYPNPAQTIVNIEGKLPENCPEAKLQLLNVNGQVLKTGVYTGQTKQQDVSDLKSGIYFLEIIYSKKQKSTYKLIVNN